MHRFRSRAAGTVVIVLLGAVGLAGCGGDDEPTGPEASGSGSGSSDPSESDSSSSTADEPSAEAATGAEVTTEHVTLNLPDTWRQEKLSAGSTSASAEPKDEGDISSIRITDIEVPGEALPLGRLARDSIDVLGSEMDLAVQAPVEVAGVETYHVAGSFGDPIAVDAFGTSVDGAVVSIRFELWTVDSEKKREEIIDSVLASVEWSL